MRMTIIKLSKKDVILFILCLREMLLEIRNWKWYGRVVDIDWKQ
jgi:hypothetical protein